MTYPNRSVIFKEFEHKLSEERKIKTLLHQGLNKLLISSYSTVYLPKVSPRVSEH